MIENGSICAAGIYCLSDTAGDENFHFITMIATASKSVTPDEMSIGMAIIVHP